MKVKTSDGLLKTTIEGLGASARPQHFNELLSSQCFPWLEVLADNYLHEGSHSSNHLVELAEIYPLVFHCVGLSLGSSTDFNWEYMKNLKELARRIQPHWISDHLCFSSFGSSHYHDLIPLPYTEEVAHHLAERINVVQDFFELPFLMENVSHYMAYSASEMEEPEFLNQVLSQTSANLLLDVNNIYVNSFNHGFDPYPFIDQIDLSRVKQIHLAGFKNMGGHLVDTHSKPVSDKVCDLYGYTLRKAKRSIPTCLEWDEDIPTFDVFKSELQKIESLVRVKLSQEITKIQQAYDRFIKFGESEELSSLLTPGHNISPKTSLQIYRNNYLSSLLSSLKDTYEACVQLLDLEPFERMGRDYISKHSSSAPPLSSYGQNFPQFLTTSPMSKEIPFLSELARYEWDLKEVILGNSQPNYKLSLAPNQNLHGHFFSSPYPLREIWSALINDSRDEIPEGDLFEYLIVKIDNGCKTLSINAAT